MGSISFKNIKKIYGNNFTAIHNFNLEILDKEFIILVGPSGCGKSTLLRMIAGLEEISDGEMYIDGKQINNIPTRDREISMVFQDYALYPHMTVYENMEFGLKLRKVPKDKISFEIKKAAEILDIGHLLNRKPKELSGGQRQRVALGRAIVRKPKVFLFDEPLSNLDAKLRMSMRSEIKKLHEELKTTFVYVTHDQVEAMTMADRIVVMKDGFMQQADTPKRIYKHPQNKFVAEFIGSPSINTFKVKLSLENDKYYLLYKGDKIEVPFEKFSSETLSQYLGKELILGIRPENMGLSEIKETEETKEKLNTLQGKIFFMELMGPEIYAYIHLEQDQIICRLDAETSLKVGVQVEVKIYKDLIHLFDPMNELSISERAQDELKSKPIEGKHVIYK